MAYIGWWRQTKSKEKESRVSGEHDFSSREIWCFSALAALLFVVVWLNVLHDSFKLAKYKLQLRARFAKVVDLLARWVSSLFVRCIAFISLSTVRC